MKRFFRTALRCVRIGCLCIIGAADYFFRIRLGGKSADLAARAQWLQRWTIVYLRILDARVTVRGQPPERGVLVCNHLSYLDILVLSSICPLVFLSKSEVRSWPVVGWYTNCAGTLYIRRQNKSDVARLGAAMVPVVNSGVVVTLFLEGTSTNGDTVLPFHASLLAPAEEHHWPATAAWLHYGLQDGDARQELCYWGDMTFFPHILNVYSKRGFEVYVEFAEPLTEKFSRKEMARELHTRVCRIRSAHLGKAADPTPMRPIASAS